MIGFLWVVIENTYSYFVGTEKVDPAENKEQENEGIENDVTTNKLTNQQNTLALEHKIKIDDVLIRHSDFKYLKIYNNRNLKQKKCNLSVLEKAVKYGTKSNHSSSQILKNPNNLTSIEEAKATDISALVPFYKTNQVLNKVKFVKFEKNTISLQEFKDKTIKMCFNISCYSNTFKKENNSFNGFQNKSLNIFLNSFITKCLVLNITEIQMNKLQKIVEHILELLEIDKETALPNKSLEKGSKCTFEIQKQETLTSISIIEIESSQNKGLSRNHPKDDYYKEFTKQIKLNKDNKELKENISSDKNKRTTTTPNKCTEYLAYSGTPKNSCNNIKLVMEIERQLKPIKNQINELRQSINDFSLLSWQFTKTRMGSKQLLSLNTKTSKSSFNYFTNGIGSQNCPAESFYKREIKSLSPMAEMYIKLSKS